MFYLCKETGMFPGCSVQLICYAYSYSITRRGSAELLQRCQLYLISLVKLFYFLLYCDKYVFCEFHPELFLHAFIIYFIFVHTVHCDNAYIIVTCCLHS